MSLVSVNAGLPREVLFKGRTVSTGIFKEPVAGTVRLRELNLDGDRQADLSVHGGPDKAAYAYPAEHYDFWKRELPGKSLPWGMFGENFTTTDLDESSVNIGDEFRIGSALVRVTQPRMPCYKLALKFGMDDIIKRFLDSGLTGFYFSVLEEGEVKSGDALKLTKRDQGGVTVADVTRLYAARDLDKTNVDLLRRAIQVEALPEGWRDYFQSRLDTISSKQQGTEQ
jgi:MOSC domain-containing protein YiiM